jgi:predicted metal-dependent peptidase
VPRIGSGTIGIESNWRLYADPAVLDSWPASEVGAVLVHLLSHVLRDHAARAEAAGVTGDETVAWLLAADAEVNDDLRAAGYLSEAAPDLPSDFNAEEGLLAEEYLRFALLHARRAILDCGSGADGRQRDGDHRTAEGVGSSGAREGSGSAEAAGLTPHDQQLVRRGVAQEIHEAEGKEPGSVPGGWARWADQVLAPQVDWRRELASRLRKALAITTGAVDYSYRRPSRRAPRGSRVVFPSLQRPLPEVAVVVDTSGSMNDTMLGRALAEIEGLLAAVGAHGALRVVAVDAAVQSVQRVARARNLTLTGGGGTDLAVGLEAAAALRPRPSVIVVLTDGYTHWPAAPPKAVRVVIGLFEKGGRRPGWDPPPWARPVWIREAPAR